MTILFNLSLPTLPLFNIIIPNLYQILALPVAVGMFFVVWPLEAYILRRVLPGCRPWRDAFLINLFTTLLGFLPSMAFKIMWGDLSNLTAWLVGGWALSVLVEGLVLIFLEKHAPREKIFLASLIANTISYILVALLIFSIPKSAFEPNPEPVKLCESEYHVMTWQDLNQNGLLEPDEPPLSWVQFYLHPSITTGTQHTGQDGTWMGTNDTPCPTGTPEPVTKLITVIVPDGCQLTTPKELNGQPYRFGFLCTGASSPEQETTRQADYECRNASAASISEALVAQEYAKSLYLSDCLLSISPKAAEIWDLFYAVRGDAHAALLDISAALVDYQKALDLNEDNVDANVCNHACWYIGLYVDPQLALDYCEQAVAKIDPASALPYQMGMARDSRGLVYALLGRYEEAAADFQAYIDELEGVTDPEFIANREQRLVWVEQLLKGENPFTPEVLQELRGR